MQIYLVTERSRSAPSPRVLSTPLGPLAHAHGISAHLIGGLTIPFYGARP